MIIKRFFLGALWFAVGYLILRKRKKIVDLGVRSYWADKYLGSSYTAVGLFGIIVMLGTMFYVLGIGDNILKPLFEGVGNMFNQAGKL